MKNAVDNKLIVSASVVLVVLVITSMVYSHCQIPCGIYDDSARFNAIAENITTIEKSMKQITELSGQDKPNLNQIVRWIQNKDNHADDTSDIITYYFMAQRIKPVDKTNVKAYEKYIRQLTLLHQMLVYCTRAKQTTDLSNVEKLRTLLTKFRTAYFDFEESTHEH